MKISWNWLQDYVRPSSSLAETARKLELATCEIESLTDKTAAYANVVIGKVETVTQHPSADRLRIATVRLKPNQKRQIVCGAQNLAVGQLVPVALPGAVVTSHKTGEVFTITETTLRGERSQGMICAADELGLEPEGDGIMVLQEGRPGQPFAEAYHLDDAVLDLEITPNRPDLLSYQGIAREIATFEKKPLLDIPISTLEEKGRGQHGVINVRIQDSKACKRYSALCLENVSVQESPQWLKSRLELSGIRPVNNVVDITNYVMLELGQPIHAFDLDKLSRNQGQAEVIVRNAESGESIALLDGKTRALNETDIVIATKHEAVALAGIMGGASTEVDGGTTRIMLESAHFSGIRIRQSSRRLGLRSEASSRFEKELDAELTVTALKRAVYLLNKLGTGEVLGPVFDQRAKSKENKGKIHLNFARVEQLLGVHISVAECKGILQPLGFHLSSLTKSSCDVTPPSWRQDIEEMEDVVEELIRIWGFDRLPASFPSGPIKPPKPNLHYSRMLYLKKTMAQAGGQETIHIPFTSVNDLKRLGLAPETVLELDNPLSQETAYMIPDHLANFLPTVAKYNLDNRELFLFEAGKVFRADRTEKQDFSLLIRTDASIESGFRHMKGAVERLLKALDPQRPVTYRAASQKPHPALVEKICLEVVDNGAVIGYFGLIEPSVIRSFKIRQATTVFFARFDANALTAHDNRELQTVTLPSPFPGIERDISVVTDESVPFEAVAKELNADRHPFLADWRLNDLYRGNPLPEGKKSLTLRLSFVNREKTLENAEVDTIVNDIAKRLTSNLPAILS